MDVNRVRWNDSVSLDVVQRDSSGQIDGVSPIEQFHNITLDVERSRVD
jgi:hypothetical protein